jgi:hypothetical protein
MRRVQVPCLELVSLGVTAAPGSYAINLVRHVYDQSCVICQNVSTYYALAQNHGLCKTWPCTKIYKRIYRRYCHGSAPANVVLEPCGLDFVALAA